MTAESRTHRLADHAVNLETREIPDDVLDFAKLLIADTVGVLLAASSGRAVTTATNTFGSTAGPCTIVGTTSRAGADVAAFVNGTGGHDIELDDTHSPSRTHAASVIIPAALAAAELSNCSGSTLIAGVAAGYDVQVRLSKAIGVQQQFDRGFHPSSVCGSVGAAATAGRILGLDTASMVYALALASSQSSGLLTFEDDSSHMIKSFQTGIAARNGLYAALLARNGYLGPEDALAGRHNMLTAFGGDAAKPDLLVADLGVAYSVGDSSLKRHACCGQTHAALDALLQIMADEKLSADDVDTIDIKLAHNAVPVIDGNPLWTHNIQYVAAIGAREGRVGREHFTQDWTTDPAIAALAARVTVSGDDDLQSRFPSQKGAIVTVTDRKGVPKRVQRNGPLGNPRDRLPHDAVRAKFNGLAGARHDDDDVAELWNLLLELDSLPQLGRVFELLRGR